jgi:hypothetical protein
MTETNRYEHGKIYKIISPHTDKIYVGSTCKKYLSQRLVKHKSDYKQWLKDNKNNLSSFRLLEMGDVEIILLESVNCKTKDELHKKEREYIEKFKDIIINKNIPTRTKREWYDINIEKIKEQDKQYQKEHKKEISEKKKQYREKHKEELCKYSKEYRENHKEEIKEYFEKHKEEIKEKHKQYREKHKEKIKQKYDCVCGKQSAIYRKTRHEKSKHHINFISNQ